MTVFPIIGSNQSFRTEYKYIDNLHPEYNSVIHLHKEWKFVRVIKGQLNIQIDSNEYMMVPGNFALIYDSAHHLLIPDDCVYECVIFDMHKLFRTIEPAKKHLYSFYNKTFLPYFQRTLYLFILL